MFLSNFYKKDTEVWVKHSRKAWEKAIIKFAFMETYPLFFLMKIQNSIELTTLIVNSNDMLPILCYPEEDVLINNIDNLTDLPYVQEPIVFHMLHLRFKKQLVYTYCGAQILIFLNPCIKVPTYENEVIMKWHNQGFTNLKPHVFSIAEKAYRRLERDKCDQSIIFSGESGAGKTENAKHAILYLITINSKEDSLKAKVLSSLTLLEAFGNAYTKNSCNSSRFGQFLQLQYNMNQQLIGAVLQTYLLDTSRLISQVERERNFNIFYQLLSVKDNFPYLQLCNEENFCYLNLVNQTNDASNPCNFTETLNAMKVIGLSDDQQNGILRTLSALLYLGNIDFQKYEAEVDITIESCYIHNLNCLEKMLQLFEVDFNKVITLRKLFCFKKIFSQESEILQPQSVEGARKMRNSLAKYIYSMLFNWIVMRINASLRSPCEVESFIGILDLYGFEKYGANSLEQFWINYANEKLEQYHRWPTLNSTFMKFVNNDNIIELLEAKNGVIDVLCDKTRLSQRQMDVDLSCIEDLEKKCGKSGSFKRINNTSDFVISHFLGDVRYNSNEFVEKNCHTAIKELLDILKTTKNDFLKRLIQQELLKLTATATATTRRRTSVDIRVSSSKNLNKLVMSDFRNSLSLLMSKLQKTNPHYVRCIKTNDENKAFYFHPNRVNEQLQAFKMKETVEITATAFVNQFKLECFFQRYHCLCEYEILQQYNMQEVCQTILHNYSQGNSYYYNVGMQKILLKEDFMEDLELLRANRRNWASVIIQCNVRCYIHRKRFKRICQATLLIQRQVRKFLRYRASRRALEKQVAVKTQNCVRDCLARPFIQNEDKFKKETEDEEEKELLTAAATEIQRQVRGFLARRMCERRQRDIVLVQACVRRFLARLHFNRLKLQRTKDKSCLSLDMISKFDFVTESKEKDKSIDDDFSEKVRTLKYDVRTHEISSTFKRTKVKKEKPKTKVPVSNPLNFELDDTINIHREEEFQTYEKLLDEAFLTFDKNVKMMAEKYKIDLSEINEVKASREETERAEVSSDDKNDDKTCSVKSSDSFNADNIGNYYQGMIYFNTIELDDIIKHLVTEINYLELPECEQDTLAPIIFMCIRYLDMINDDNSTHSLIELYTRMIEQTVISQGSLDLMLFWFATSHVLLDFVKKYSRESDLANVERELYHLENVTFQSDYWLKNLELKYERLALEDLNQLLARKVIEHMKSDTIELATTSLFTMSTLGDDSSHPLNLLLDKLMSYFQLFRRHRINEKTIVQLFDRFFSAQNTLAFNSFMTRTELFSSEQGIKIRCNIRRIENWASDLKILAAVKSLGPITQAVRLLQRLPINISEVDQICKDYDELTCAQIKNILVNFKPNNYEESISTLVIQAIQLRLTQGRQDFDDTIILDEFISPIKFTFCDLQIRFEDIEIPESYDLQKIKKI